MRLFLSTAILLALSFSSLSLADRNVPQEPGDGFPFKRTPIMKNIVGTWKFESGTTRMILQFCRTKRNRVIVYRRAFIGAPALYKSANLGRSDSNKSLSFIVRDPALPLATEFVFQTYHSKKFAKDALVLSAIGGLNRTYPLDIRWIFSRVSKRVPRVCR